MSGAVITLPWETRGLAPITTRRSVRSMSGTGSSAWFPYSWSEASIRGCASTELDENTLRLPSSFSHSSAPNMAL